MDHVRPQTHTPVIEDMQSSDSNRLIGFQRGVMVAGGWLKNASAMDRPSQPVYGSRFCYHLQS